MKKALVLAIGLAQFFPFNAALAMQISSKGRHLKQFKQQHFCNKAKGQYLDQLRQHKDNVFAAQESLRKELMKQRPGYFVPTGSLPDVPTCPSAQWYATRRHHSEPKRTDGLHDFLNYLTLFPVPNELTSREIDKTKILYTKEPSPYRFTSIQDVINDNGAGLYIKMGYNFYAIPTKAILSPIELNLEAFFVQTNAEVKLQEFFNKINGAEDTEEWFYLNDYLKLFKNEGRKKVPGEVAGILLAHEREFTFEHERQASDDYAGGMAYPTYETYPIYRPWPLIISLSEEKFIEHFEEEYKKNLANKHMSHKLEIGDLANSIVEIERRKQINEDNFQTTLAILKKEHEERITSLRSRL